MEEENNNANSEEGMSESGLLAGKFKSVDALLHAYGELEAEFTRRSQRLKALEDRLQEPQAERAEEPEPCASAVDDKTRARIVSDYLASRSVPLMGAGGGSLTAPRFRPATIREAGELALGYLKRQK